MQALGGNGGALMMQQIRTLHALGDAFEGQASLNSDTTFALLLMSIATAYRAAADQLDAEDRAAYAPAAGKAVAE